MRIHWAGTKTISCYSDSSARLGRRRRGILSLRNICNPMRMRNPLALSQTRADAHTHTHVALGRLRSVFGIGFCVINSHYRLCFSRSSTSFGPDLLRSCYSIFESNIMDPIVSPLASILLVFSSIEMRLHLVSLFLILIAILFSSLPFLPLLLFRFSLWLLPLTDISFFDFNALAHIDQKRYFLRLGLSSLCEVRIHAIPCWAAND